MPEGLIGIALSGGGDAVSRVGKDGEPVVCFVFVTLMFGQVGFSLPKQALFGNKNNMQQPLCV